MSDDPADAGAAASRPGAVSNEGAGQSANAVPRQGAGPSGNAVPRQGGVPSEGAGQNENPVAEAAGVTKRFGATVALNDVGLRVAPGEAHALVGRNGAGKSTLVSILTGLTRPDHGRISFNGEAAPPVSDPNAWRRHVACVYQKSMIIPSLSVAENLYLNRQDLGGGGRISWRALRSRAADLLDTWGIDVDPRAEAGSLTVEQRQTLEIARALSFGARFIILDEPTAQLDGAGIERLFDRLRTLRDAGVAFLFISHHLQEVYELCQTVTVYRDARHVLTAPVAELGREALVEAMTGEATGLREIGSGAAPIDDAAREALTVDGLGVQGIYQDVSFRIRAGEVLGLAGAVGAGATALGETIVGLRRATAGTVSVDGRPVRPGSVPASLAAGIGFVPEDRHREGLVPLRSIAENMTLTVTQLLGRFGFVSAGARRDAARELMERLDVKAAGPDQPVSALSGGNQQKVVMGRALAGSPQVLVLLRPTAGVDVKSKESLLGTVATAASDGCAALIVSDELDDLRAADRVIVMFHGRVVGEFARGWDDRRMVAAIEGLSGEHDS
ncbi:sugar ABC transporter ATP-binding protein [Rugosimonospora africana]|uniref:Multidrug ABC transporter ATP-binding protein n=1 Tax=Rugosimonospora africana TaxID=556532 RepID=A0A8J3VVU9_9ACTN|nr:sugar ABC transporter ATP-binding protein [Rugosimonospora africana]GIH21057.1 multidrug ABC transporter ATP-binding protein [Rugosimonospora africana]